MPKDKAVVSKICKKTRRVLIASVVVKEGQHLHYFITVQGSKPIFTLACEDKEHFNADELGEPRKEYDVVWERSSADQPSGVADTYTFAMSFAGADKYTLRVVLHDDNHKPVGDGVIIDADYEGNPVTTLCNESFVVRI